MQMKYVTDFEERGYLLCRPPGGAKSKSWSYGKKRTKTEAYAEAEKYIASCPTPKKREPKAKVEKPAKKREPKANAPKASKKRAQKEETPAPKPDPEVAAA